MQFDHGIEEMLQAINEDNYLKISLLLKQGVNINGKYGSQHDNTPLSYVSAGNGTIEMLSFLIEHGADINHKSEHGQSCLYWAIEINDMDRIKLLLEAGADPNTDSAYGETPLKCVIAKSFPEHLKHTALELLLRHGADPNLNPFYGTPPLALSVKNACSADVVHYLLEHGAHISGYVNAFQTIQDLKHTYNIDYTEPLIDNEHIMER